MGSMRIENIHAKKENIMVKLIKGKETAIQLQTLLHKPVEDHGSFSPEELALQIFRSFAESLSEFTSCTESDQIAAVDCGGSACSGQSKKKRVVKDRRGCYKRRRSIDSWTTVSPTMEDGSAWRKYGQKNILNSEHPRCYFRCTHKHEGCKAKKQVQRMKGSDPILYETTYFNRHSCTHTQRAPHFIVESDPVEPNLISFQKYIPQDQNPITISSSVKLEDTLSEDVSDDHETKSTLEDTWQDMIGLEPLGYKPEWAPSHVLDMEVDQLSDINSFQYFDDEIINY